MRTHDIRDAGRAAPPLEAVLYSASARVVSALLRALASASLLAMLGLLLLADGPVSPLRLIRLVTGLYLLPALAVLAVRRMRRATLHVQAGALVVEQRRRRIEIPLGSIAAIEPWLLPLPGSGVWLRLGSGRRWSSGLEMANPMALVDALVAAGAAPRLGAAARHPSMILARARCARRPRSWRRALLDFPLFALLPTLPLFRVHQIIAYGGALGEYRQYGLGAYLAGFAIYWAALTIYLMLYAAALRVPVELVTAGTVVLAPERAPAMRRVLDRLSAVLYYTGVPAVVALRFVPW